ncbi:MAG: heme lyase CcmF/NrfE family subunit [Candidatus Berkiellales bacterium]
MIPEIGLFCLILAFCLALTLTFHPLLKPVNAISGLTRSLAFGQCFFVLLSFLTLILCFLLDDFSVEYIAQNSNSKLPLIYKFCAVWGAHEGSLLLWSLILSGWTLLVACQRKIPPHFLKVVLVILGGVNLGILGLLLNTSDPFLRFLPFYPEEGADLNPLLQDPGFVLHPPLLYLGYVGFAVPFAFAMAALWIGDNKMPWASWAKPWALLAWGFLTAGITLGSFWAYYELGWGGWWFWDPVENASFMPWLVGAALVHALGVCAHRGLFASWCVILAISAFMLSLIGTFLVRSGVLSSVHSFASDPARGYYILSFLTIILIGSMSGYFLRIHRFQHVQRLFLFSKGSLILLGNVILCAATLTVLLGTLYPLAIEVFANERLSVGPPYFNSVFIPLMLPLLLLMAITPHVHWQHEKLIHFWARIKKAMPLILGIALILIYFLWQGFPILSLLGIIFSAFLLFGTVFKAFRHYFKNRAYAFSQGASQSSSGVYRRVNEQRRMTCNAGSTHKNIFGLILGHMGLAISVLGISLSSALETEKDLKMAPGEIAHIAGYDFLMQSIDNIAGSNFEGKQAHFLISQQQKNIAHVYPQKRFFIARQMAMSETAIHVGLWQDFYLALGEKLEGENWSVRIYIKPFIRWIWLGGILIALGTCVASFKAFRQMQRPKDSL